MRSAFNVLVATDQADVADDISSALNHAQWVTHRASNLVQASDVVRACPTDLLILDLDMINCRVAIHVLSECGHPVPPPVIAISRQEDIETRLNAFEEGADDVVVMPFNSEEFRARCRALLRRALPESPGMAPVLRRREMEIDLPNKRVRVDGDDVRLTWLEQRLLYLLAANADRVVTRDEILDHLWGVDYAPESNVVDRHIRNLRSRLKDNWRRPRFIATIAGEGYEFIYSFAVFVITAAMQVSDEWLPWSGDLLPDLVDLMTRLPA